MGLLLLMQAHVAASVCGVAVASVCDHDLESRINQCGADFQIVVYQLCQYGSSMQDSLSWTGAGGVHVVGCVAVTNVCDHVQESLIKRYWVQGWFVNCCTSCFCHCDSCHG